MTSGSGRSFLQTQACVDASRDGRVGTQGPIVTGFVVRCPNDVVDSVIEACGVKQPPTYLLLGPACLTELRWGILSTADIARHKVVPGMRKAARCRIVAIASRDLERARRVASELDIPTAHSSYEALLSDPDVDAVYVPLPNHLHAEWSIAAMAAGKHVLCEKPLALMAEDAQRMVDAARSAGVHLMEAFMYRLHPSWVAVADLVASGRIGRLTSIQSWFSYYNDDATNIRNIQAAGGGALYDIGCYSVSLSRFLFAAEPRRVAASVTRDPANGVDVLTSAILEFDAGVASFTCSTRTETDQRVHVYGTDGRISIGIPFNIPPDRPTQVFLTAGGDPPVDPHTEVLTFATADPYTVEAEEFAAAVLDGRPTPVPPEDAVANLRVIERIFAAAEV
jgi:predicted dehydrogenase